MSSGEIERAVAAVAAGQVIGLPTDTVYGIGVDPYRKDAVERIFAAKRRPETSPLPVLIAHAGDAGALALVDDRAVRLAERYWPGPLTIVLPLAAGARLHLGGDGTTVGLRCPGHDLARRLLAGTGPLAVTSANRHGAAPAGTADEVRRIFGSDVEVVVDGGLCDGAPSTVVSLVGREVSLLREGAIPFADLQAEVLLAGG